MSEVPNVSALVGKEVALELVQLAGGLGALAALPATALRHLGEHSARESDRDDKFRAGVLLKAPLVLSVAREFRGKAVSKVANKAKLAAGVDASGSNPDGSFGEQVRNELAVAFDAMQAPPPGREEKPLAIPKDLEKKNRAGAKLQRVNAKFKETLVERKAEVIKFNVDVDRQQEELLRSRDVLAAAHASRFEEEMKQRRIAENGGRPRTKETSAVGIGGKRPANDDRDELLDLVIK